MLMVCETTVSTNLTALNSSLYVEGHSVTVTAKEPAVRIQQCHDSDYLEFDLGETFCELGWVYSNNWEQ